MTDSSLHIAGSTGKLYFIRIPGVQQNICGGGMDSQFLWLFRYIQRDIAGRCLNRDLLRFCRSMDAAGSCTQIQVFRL